MRLLFTMGVAGSTLRVGDATVHAIRAGAVSPRAVELWSGYGLFLTATTWLYLSEDSRRSRPVTLALVVVFTVAGLLPYFLHV